ncbi:MAG: hypothetical protein IKA10_08730 [Oscillospiraceae bacterium]|nr:hypothetical protein [Oscillospiraceae bacterium]
MDNHKNKMTAPVIITVILILYYAVYFGVLAAVIGGIWKYLFAIVPLLFAAVMIKVCIERINEIKKGEEDDIGKY